MRLSRLAAGSILSTAFAFSCGSTSDDHVGSVERGGKGGVGESGAGGADEGLGGAVHTSGGNTNSGGVSGAETGSGGDTTASGGQSNEAGMGGNPPVVSAGAGAGGETSSEGGAPSISGNAGAAGAPELCATDGTVCSTGYGDGLCCAGACVAGNCCAASDCGANDGAGYVCSDNHCVNVAGSLSGLLWQLPCSGESSSTSCPTTANVNVSTNLGGAEGVTYDVKLHFRGVVEQKTYSGGCGDGSYWVTGGSYDGGDPYNIYRLTVSSPPQTFYLNSGTSNQTRVFALDFEQTILMNAGATITLFADAVDSQEIKNIDAQNNPVEVSGVSLAQPYDGQFIQMDVETVTPEPTTSTPVSGSAGSALSFHAAQFVTVPTATSLQPSSLTQEVWFNFSGASGGYNSLFGMPYQTGTADSYTIWFQDGVLHAGVQVSSPAGAAAVTWQAVNEWHHAALTFDETSKLETFYIDGLPVSCATVSTAPSYDAHPLVIGADYDNTLLNGYWNGKLDDVRLFSTARTASQVWADMHAHKLGPTAGLVGEWNFDEGAGQVVGDASGNGNDGVLGTTDAEEAADAEWVTSDAP